MSGGGAPYPQADAVAPAGGRFKSVPGTPVPGLFWENEYWSCDCPSAGGGSIESSPNEYERLLKLPLRGGGMHGTYGI